MMKIVQKAPFYWALKTVLMPLGRNGLTGMLHDKLELQKAQHAQEM